MTRRRPAPLRGEGERHQQADEEGAEQRRAGEVDARRVLALALGARQQEPAPDEDDERRSGRLTRKIQRQPSVSTRKPPSGGPTLRPMYTAITLMPSARPRSCGGKTAVTMAAEVATSRAPPAALHDAAADEPRAAHAQRRPAASRRVKTAVPIR